MRQPEGAPLRIPAYRRAVAGVDDLPAVCPHALEREGQVGHREIRERDPIAGPLPSRVHPELRPALVALPAVAFLLRPGREVGAEDLSPKPKRALRIVGRELDEDDRTSHGPAMMLHTGPRSCATVKTARNRDRSAV